MSSTGRPAGIWRSDPPPCRAGCTTGKLCCKRRRAFQRVSFFSVNQGAASSTAVAAGPWKHRRGPAVWSRSLAAERQKTAASGYRSFWAGTVRSKSTFSAPPFQSARAAGRCFPGKRMPSAMQIHSPAYFRASEGGAIPPDSETRQKGHPKKMPLLMAGPVGVDITS